MTTMADRVVARHLQANRPPGARQDAKRLTHPINRPKGIDPGIIRDHGMEIGTGVTDETRPAPRDIRPEDVFPGTPRQTGVLNLAETGKDLQDTLDRQVPKDKGHDAVSNLSQYLIQTEGGGGAAPAGK